MSLLEEIFNEIQEQIGSELITTDIIDKNGISIFKHLDAKVDLPSNKPLPAPNWHGTDFRVRPDEIIPEVKKKLDPKQAGMNVAAASKQLARVMNLSSEFCKALKMGAVEDNLMTTNGAYVISRFLGDGSYLWVLTLQRTATIGTIRMTMSDMAAKLWEAIHR